jgi:hypothetical protein
MKKKANIKTGSIRKMIRIYPVICLLLVAGSCRHATDDAGGKINIPATQGVMGTGDYKKYKRITAKERKELQIDAIKADDLNKQPNRELAVGKTIYSDDKVGILLTLLHIVEDHATYEYLVSYDTLHKFVDCISIGQEKYYSVDSGTGRIEGNTVLCSYSWAEPLSERGSGISTIYTVTDDLHFKPFALPSASYPCATPFMTYETEEAPLFWEIESVVCTDASGSKWKFTVKGKGITDCRKAGAKERSVLFELTKWGWEPVADDIKVTLPAVNEGEAFETKISIPGKTLDGKSFYAFRIKR